MNSPLVSLYLSRHGESKANRPWLFLGHFDSPISPLGRQQAEVLSVHLAGTLFDAIYSSPLIRALHTTEMIAKRQAGQLLVDDRLIEQDFGDWEGLTLDEVQRKYPEDVALWQEDAMQFGPTKGESLSDIKIRTEEFCEEVLRKSTGKILVVAHGSVLNAMLSCLLRTPLHWRWSYSFEYGNFCEVALFEKQASLLRFNALI